MFVVGCQSAESREKYYQKYSVDAVPEEAAVPGAARRHLTLRVFLVVFVS